MWSNTLCLVRLHFSPAAERIFEGNSETEPYREAFCRIGSGVAYQLMIRRKYTQIHQKHFSILLKLDLSMCIILVVLSQMWTKFIWSPLPLRSKNLENSHLQTAVSVFFFHFEMCWHKISKISVWIETTRGRQWYSVFRSFT